MVLTPEPRLDMDASPTIEEILAVDPFISSRSRWSDQHWYLDGETGGQTKANFAIHWTVNAPGRLLDSAKFLAARLFLLRDDRVQLKHTTASTFSAGMRHMLRFMTHNVYGSFSQLDEDAFKLFNRQLGLKLADPEWYVEEFAAEEADAEQTELQTGAGALPSVEDLFGDADAPDLAAVETFPPVGRDEGEEDELTRAAAYYRLRTWRYLFEHSEAMVDAGIAALRFNPFAQRTLSEYTNDASRIAADLIPPLPDAVAIQIINRAQSLLGAPAEDVLRLQHLYIDCLARMDREPTTEERARIRARLEAFEFTKADGQAWRQPIVLPPERGGGGDALRDLLVQIRDAALLTIFCGTGVRISELCSLTADGVLDPLPLLGGQETSPTTEVTPHCVSVRISKTGLNEHFFMNGLLYKNEEVPKEEEWLIGSRPRGDDFEPPVLRAIRVLERLYEPWRRLSADNKVRGRLILGFRCRGLPRSSSTIIPITAGSLRFSLKRFIAQNCGLEELGHLVAANKAIRPYVETRGACIRTHQWRKTFALYMMKVDDRMIPALAHHFKHLSIAVTENSYMPKDPSMLAAADSVHMQETARFFYEQVHAAGGSFGRLDDILAEHREEFEKLVGDLPLPEALPEIQRFCLDRDIRIFHAEHGRCLFGANPDKARCHEVSGTGSWRNSKPNHMTRTPSLCSGCSNFSVSIEHAGFWRRRYVENETSWILSDRSVQFRVIQKRAQQAAQVLKALGVSLPIILDQAPSDLKAKRERQRLRKNGGAGEASMGA